MTDPRTILGQARQGAVPVNWRVFTKKRGKLSGFLRGSSHDPDPLLVITPDGAIEYANERKPLTVVDFYDLAEISGFALLRVVGRRRDLAPEAAYTLGGPVGELDLAR